MGKDEEIREAMDVSTLNSLKHLETLNKDSNEYKTAVDNTMKLYRARMETADKDCAYDEAYQKRIAEKEKQIAEEKYRQQQFEENRRQFNQKLLVEVGTTGAKLAMFAVVGRWSAVIESGGMIASGTAKNLVRSVQKFIEFHK